MTVERSNRFRDRLPMAGLLAVVAIVLVIASWKYYDKIHEPSRDGQLTRSAFLRWRDQVLDLEQSKDIYRLHNYPNPPIQALILYPFMKLDRIPGAFAWFNAKVLMAMLCVGWVYRLIRSHGPPLPLLSVYYGLFLASHSILGDLSHGNVNIFIAFLVFASLELLRRGWGFSSGIVLALAISCKVTPGLFLPYFLWKRAWKAALGTVLGCGLWLLIVPGLALGFQYNQTLLVSWFDTMVAPFVVEGKVTSEHANQSLPGLTYRLLTNQPSALTYDEDDGKPRPERFDNFTDIGQDGAKRLVQLFQVAFVVAVLLLCRTKWADGVSHRGLALAAECSLIVLGMLMFSERTWKHHGVVLMLPFLTLTTAVLWPGYSRALRRAIGTAMVSIFFLIAGPSIASREQQDMALTYGTHTWVFLILTGCVVAVLIAERRASVKDLAESSPEQNPIKKIMSIPENIRRS
ncbi:MAG: glycosyltransferase family 87 protein [Fimbriiglobus sp.]